MPYRKAPGTEIRSRYFHLRVIIRAAHCHSGRVKPASGFCAIKSVTSLVMPIFSGRKPPSSARNRGKSALTFSRLVLMNSGVHFLFFFRLMCRHFVFHSPGRKLRRRRSDYMFLRWWRRNNVAFFLHHNDRCIFFVYLPS